MLKVIQQTEITKIKSKLNVRLKWILLLSFLAVLAGAANWVEGIHNLTARPGVTPAYTIEKLTNDENTVLYWKAESVPGFYMLRSDDFPFFDGIKYVDNITATSARVGFDLALNYDRFYYIAYALNSQGTWDAKSLELLGSANYTWRYMTISGLEPDSWQTVRIVMARDPRNKEGGRSDYNQIVARFKTKPAQNP